jgi:hypothetical protein
MRAKEFIIEAENPMYIGGNQNSPIPGTPPDLQPQPDPVQVRKKKRNEKKMEKWIKNTSRP